MHELISRPRFRRSDSLLYIETLFGRQDARICVRTVPERESLVKELFAKSKSPDAKQKFRFNFSGTFADLQDRLQKRNAAGFAIYATINDTDGHGVKKENVARVRNLVLDLDGSPLPDEWRIPPHMIVETSHGKFQATWCIEPTKDIDTAEDISRRLALEYGGDMKVCDVSHVFRIPGFTHQKPGRKLFTSRVVGVGFEPPVRLAAFDFLPRVPPRRKSSSHGVGLIHVKTAALLFEHFPVDALNSNEAWITFAMALHSACDGDDEVAEMFFDFCTTDPAYGNEYDDACNRNRWASFTSDREGGVTAGTLRKLCRDHGVPGDIIFQIFNDATRDFEND